MDVPSVITIDGPAGAGKSTLGELLARRLGYLYFDTGVMYRALAYAASIAQIDQDDADTLGQLAETTTIEVSPPHVEDGRQYTVLVDGHDATWQIRRPEVEGLVSAVARHPQVRQVLRQRQRQIGQAGRVVMVGRDVGSVVMPDAPLKIFLEASLDERARRRTAEVNAREGHADQQRVRADVARRDALDRHVMQPAPDALIIDCDPLTPEQEVELILAHIRRI
ncbi:MAG: (d)CMP kinase [Roseiflexaceae bacterium]|nr:(d)CMP kinase [Roseiflexaceae bacterium]